MAPETTHGKSKGCDSDCEPWSRASLRSNLAELEQSHFIRVADNVARVGYVVIRGTRVFFAVSADIFWGLRAAIEGHMMH